MKHYSFRPTKRNQEIIDSLKTQHNWSDTNVLNHIVEQYDLLSKERLRQQPQTTPPTTQRINQYGTRGVCPLMKNPSECRNNPCERRPKCQEEGIT